MARFLARRLGLIALTLWLMSIAVFVITEVLPGNVAQTILGHSATPEAVAALQHQLGLDAPPPVLYVRWITGFVSGNWGDSPSLQTPISSLIPGRLFNSLVLAVAALIVIMPLSIAFGVLAALRQDRFVDRIISITGLSLMAVPEFVSGIILLSIFGIWLHWLPTSSVAAGGDPLTSPQYLVLPVLALGIVFFGYVARMMRASTIAVLGSAYTRTAMLKGLPLRLVLRRHVLRNALVPTITVVMSSIGYLVGGLVVVENLFSYPGIGGLLLTAGLSHDVPLLEDCVMIIAVIYMASNLAADLLYAYLNPQIRYSQA
ncbi:MAG TPA: ABC transporter permease [Chloroflexota bacterium]|nr:ABC transporter permease [Chloroflexota bacterium]